MLGRDLVSVQSWNILCVEKIKNKKIIPVAEHARDRIDYSDKIESEFDHSSFS